ncbi:MAG: hypothetical protein VX768_03200 [Planctomycetota bacterium]|nr:hypothetical protein [Planctomycetota bacterium]
MSCIRLTAFFAVVFLLVNLTSAQPEKSQRKLGRGVLKVIPPEILPEETRTYFPKINGFNPEAFKPETAAISATSNSQSRNIILRREIGCLEFSFTALQVRVIEVPQPSGKMQRKTIWYLPYRIRNLGSHYSPQVLDDTTRAKFKQEKVFVPGFEVEDSTGLLGDDRNPFEIKEGERDETSVDVEKMTDIAKTDYKTLQTNGLKKTDQASKYSMIDRFFGRFILEGRVQTDFSLRQTPTPYGLRDKPSADLMGKYQKKSYLDQIIPSVLPSIQAIEDPNTRFQDSVSISRTSIPADPDPNSPGVWGVAVWQDLDPRLDYITIYVTGLSNAFKVFEMPDGTKKFKHKTLQLNFWRPGDIHDEAKDRIRYGIPLTRDPAQQKEICEFYDLPGPVISVQEFDKETDKKRELFVVEGKIDRNFDLDLQKGLDAGQLPAAIAKQFMIHGIDVPAGTNVRKLVDSDDLSKPGTKLGIRWETTVNVDGKDRNFRFVFRPRSWQKIGERVEIIKRVESVWVYR